MKVLSNPCTVVVSEDLHLFAGLSGTEDFSTMGGKAINSLWYSFEEEHVRDYFQRTHFKLMRTASFSNETLFGQFEGEDNTPLRSGESREKRLRIVRREWKMWIGLLELEKVHGTSNTQQERQPWHHMPIASISYHEALCQLRQHSCRPFHSAE